MRFRLIPLILAMTLFSTTALAQTTLKNDTYSGGSASLAVQAGFGAGESFAALFKPPKYPFTIQKVQALIAPKPGGSSSTKTFNLTIYQDASPALTPGTKKYDKPIQVTSSASAISQTDITKDNIQITAGYIRISYRQLHKGTPSIVRDKGPLKAKTNLIHGDVGTGSKAWYWTGSLFLQGNWIIRVIGTAGGTVTPDSGTVTLDSGTATKDKGATTKDKGGTATDTGATQQDSKGVGMGAEGEKCYPNGTCNAGLTCLSKLCVKVPDAGTKTGGDGEDDGCSVSAGVPADASPGLLLMALALLLVIRRRR